MALPLAPGLSPAEVAFICEMELVTVIPRQRLEAMELLGGTTKPLQPPHRSDIPLWLALLLKRQRRANIVSPPWLQTTSLAAILEFETEHSKEAFSPPPKLPSGYRLENTSPPFLPSCTADGPPESLPFHWLEVGEMLLDAAPDDFEDADQVRRLMRDLREVRMAKVRASVEHLDAAGGVTMNGVGGMEIAEARAFVGGVIDSLRRINASREQAQREQREQEDAENGYSGTANDDEMDL